MDLVPWRNNPNSNLNAELQTLTEKMERLGGKADDIQCQVRNEELQPSKKRKSEVTSWLKQVEKVKQEFESIKAECLSVVERIDHRKSRELLKEMKGTMEKVDQLLKQGEFTQGLVLNDVKPEGLDLVTTKLEGSTPLRVKDEVRSAFTRGESRLGIFGMGGVGKTTMAMHVNNEILSGCWDCFNHVFYVTVSRGCTLLKLQHDISEALTLELKSKDETRRAAELHMSLKRRDKSLLILDDMWEDIPMEKVGVAVEGDGCKLLITTRKRDVCRKMSCGTIVEMKPLRKKEAWDLFVSKLGNYESLNDAIKCVARSIVEECGGLPLAIITMASCMRGECDEREWRYILRQLQNPSSNQIDDMDDKVFNILKLSYDRLSNDKLRQCLLHCALYIEDYGNMSHFFEFALLGNDGTRKENIEEGHHMLKALIDASLVEWTTNRMYRCNIVKMHDLIRDMAIKIIGSKGIVKLGKGMKEMPRKEEWTKDLVLVSLMSNEIEGIGDEIRPECPNLSVLILGRNFRLRNIPHSFFVHMKGLKCLDLSGNNSIQKLPNSIDNLCNLEALLLYGCSFLNAVPSLAGLIKLKDLNLSGNLMLKELPGGVEELINLQSLNISGTGIQSISEGLLCKLCKLESFLSNYKINIVPEELMSLRQLRNFEGRIDVCSDWFDQLETYSILVGDYRNGIHANPRDSINMYWFESKRVRCIHIHGRQLGIRREVGFKVPHNVKILQLKGCSFGVECLLEALPSLCVATELELCRIARCKGIKYIISTDGGKSGKCKGFHQLELVGLYEFVGLYEKEAVHPNVFFGGLRVLIISECRSVKRIWLQIDDLPNMESIEVAYCRNMEEVFATTVGAALELSCLKSITLKQLSELRCICETNVFLPCLEKLDVKECPKLDKLWSGENELPSLQHVSIEDCDEMKEIIATTDETNTTTIKWPNLSSLKLNMLPELKRIYNRNNTVFFPQLEHLTVEKCPKLKKLGLLNDNLQCLREIWIKECREMKEIFESRDGAGDDAIQFPSLERIWLKDLPELRSICRKVIVCNSLVEVAIEGDAKLENCPISVPRLLFPNTSPPFPILYVVDMPKEWWNTLCWNDPSTKFSFDRLGCLKYNECIWNDHSPFLDGTGESTMPI